MYTIGEFAAFGRVSVRMLRHYDAIGLLKPAEVDERTGYRRYAPDQLGPLVRITELRGYGCSLDAIARVLDADDGPRALTDALRARRDELVTSVSADSARIARIDERLRQREGTAMPATLTYRSLDASTVYAASDIAPGMGNENIGPVVGPLIQHLAESLGEHGRPVLEPCVCWYESTESDETMRVRASYQSETPPRPGDGYEVVDLPAVPLAAVAEHRGEMARIGDSWMRLTEQLVADGYRMTGPTREVYLVARPDLPQAEWVTELQAPVERAG